MIVEANKWLEKHLLFFDLMQEKDALRWFHVRNLEPLSGCHMTTCFYWLLLPWMADIFIFMGSFVWIVEYELEKPIGSMILPTLHVLVSGEKMGKP